jgi:quercetin dioxygenase-like cupin family protein
MPIGLYCWRVQADAQIVWMPGGVRTEIHLGAEDTGGAFCLLVDHPPPGWSLPAHLHRNESETILILEGEFEMEVDGVRSRVSGGQTVHVPKGTLHSGANVGAGVGRRVLIFSPAGMESFFADAGASSAQEEIDVATVLATATRHGWEFAAGA